MTTEQDALIFCVSDGTLAAVFRRAISARGLTLASPEALKRAARTPVGLTGLILLAVGILAGTTAGVVVGMLLAGSPSDRSALRWLLLSLALTATAAAIAGNYLWYRARLSTRPAC